MEVPTGEAKGGDIMSDMDLRAPYEVLKASTHTELGRTGLNRSGGTILEDPLSSMRGRSGRRIFKEMSMNDSTVGAMLFATKQLIRKTTWGVEAISDSPPDIEAAEFLKSCMDDMSSSWLNLISEILSMLVFGWSYHEIIYKKRNGPQRKESASSMYKDGRIGWRKIPGRAQETLWEWKFDDNTNELLGMIQQAPPDYNLRFIPIEKALLFRTEVDKDNPEGKSILRNAYRPWYFKKHIEEIEGIGIERDLAGLPVITPPVGVDLWNSDNPDAVRLRNIAEQLVRNIRRDENEGIVLPPEWTLTLLSSSSKRQFDTNLIINRYDQRMSVTLLADVVLLGAEKVGSYALSEVKKSLFATALEAILDMIAEVFNKYAIPRLFRLNVFPRIEEFPKITHGEVETPDIEVMAKYVTALTNAGFILTGDKKTDDYLRDIGGIPRVESPQWRDPIASKPGEEDPSEPRRDKSDLSTKPNDESKDKPGNKPDEDEDEDEEGGE